MEGALALQLYRVPQADGAPAETIRLDLIQGFKYSGTGNEQRCNVNFSNGVREWTENYSRQIAQGIETAVEKWLAFQNSTRTGTGAGQAQTHTSHA